MSAMHDTHNNSSDLLIVASDSPFQTDEHHCCHNVTCLCHDYHALLAPLYRAYQEGELTADEAKMVLMRKLVERAGR